MKDNKITKSEDIEGKQKESYWSMLINGIVRPPRASYRDIQLGNLIVIYVGTKQFTYNDIVYCRK